MKKTINVGVVEGVIYDTSEGRPRVTLTIVAKGDVQLGAFCDSLRQNSSIIIEYGENSNYTIELKGSDLGISK
ncbi:MAG: hypothetical protein IPH49_15790 [Ignavibacteria bacterium]|nr:hypothetical protein [Ignavibacteria bacterium]